MNETNDVLTKAANIAVDEMFALMSTKEESDIGLVMDVIAKIRKNSPLHSATNTGIINNCFSIIRNSKTMFTDIMSATTTFTLNIPMLDDAIAYFCARVCPYSVDSLIVDQAMIERLAGQAFLNGILTSNHWLFFLAYLSYNEQLLVAALIRNGYKAKSK